MFIFVSLINYCAFFVAFIVEVLKVKFAIFSWNFYVVVFASSGLWWPLIYCFCCSILLTCLTFVYPLIGLDWPLFVLADTGTCSRYLNVGRLHECIGNLCCYCCFCLCIPTMTILIARFNILWLNCGTWLLLNYKVINLIKRARKTCDIKKAKIIIFFNKL